MADLSSASARRRKHPQQPRPRRLHHEGAVSRHLARYAVLVRALATSLVLASASSAVASPRCLPASAGSVSLLTQAQACVQLNVARSAAQRVGLQRPGHRNLRVARLGPAGEHRRNPEDPPRELLCAPPHGRHRGWACRRCFKSLERLQADCRLTTCVGNHLTRNFAHVGYDSSHGSATPRTGDIGTAQEQGVSVLTTATHGRSSSTTAVGCRRPRRLAALVRCGAHNRQQERERPPSGGRSRST